MFNLTSKELSFLSEINLNRNFVTVFYILENKALKTKEVRDDGERDRNKGKHELTGSFWSSKTRENWALRKKFQGLTRGNVHWR